MPTVLALFDQFQQWVDSDWSYLVIFAVAMLDAFFPLVPSETVAITGGVLAASGSLTLGLVILCAATGAIVGDNISYGIGNAVGERTLKRIFKSERSLKGFVWAERQLLLRGWYLIIVARFVPGGRTATTFSAGYIHALRYRKFLAADIAAGIIWGAYTGLLGYFGGKQFESQPWKGLLAAFAVAVAVAGLVELVRHVRARRGAPPPEPDAEG